MIREDFSRRLIAFTVSIVKCAEKYSVRKTLQPIFHQLVRCAGSIGANVIEAQGASSGKDFVNYFHIALKSAEETKYWLLVLQEEKTVPDAELSPLLDEVSSFIKILTASINTAKRKAHAG